MRSRSFFFVFVSFCFSGLISQNYLLDSTFNGTGEVFVPQRGLATGAYSIIRQPDGKLLVGGEIELPHPFWYVSSFFLYRLNTNGQIDVSFADTGKFQSKQNPVILQQTADEIMTMTLQPDGKIIVAGAYNANLGIMRLHNNGTMDSTFGVNGVVQTNLGGMVARSIVLLGNGSFILGAGDNDFVLSKYTSNGSPDTTFGNTGVVMTDFSQNMDHCYSILLQPDGKIVAAGDRWDNATGYDFALARYNGDGSLDTLFGNGGKVTVDFGTIQDHASKVILKSNGNLFVAGFTTAGDGKFKYAALEVLSSGSLNTSFGTGGKVVANTNQRDNFAGPSVLLSNNDVVLGGLSTLPAVASIKSLMMRVTSGGQFDYTLNTNGFCYYDKPQGSNFQFYDMLLQPDGKIVACGKSDLPGDMRFEVVRFKPSSAGTITGINVLEEPELTIYPNPTNDIIYLTPGQDHNFAISLFNMVGELVLKQENKLSVDLSELPAGIYILKYSSLESPVMQLGKIVKAR